MPRPRASGPRSSRRPATARPARRASRAQAELVALADELGMLLVGPNGQGVVSTPSSLCAQIVAPYPPAGRIGVASQSGNFVSSFMNYAVRQRRRHQPRRVGRQRGQVGVPDFLELLRRRPRDRRGPGLRRGHRRRPRVLRRGRGRWPSGCRSCWSRAAPPSGGAAGRGQPHRLAGHRRPGVRRHVPPGRRRPGRAPSRRPTRWPPPSPPSRCRTGNRVAVVTTAGGWGVVTADAIAGTDLELLALPDDLRRRARRRAAAPLEPQQPDRPGRRRDQGHHPRRCSRSSPATPTSTPSCFLGMGIQSNQGRHGARRARSTPTTGSSGSSAFHERQDERYATAAVRSWPTSSASRC